MPLKTCNRKGCQEITDCPWTQQQWLPWLLKPSWTAADTNAAKVSKYWPDLSHLLLFPIYTSKELYLCYIKIFAFYLAKAHNLVYVVFGMPDLFASIISWPNMEIKANKHFPPAPPWKGKMTSGLQTSAKIQGLITVSLSSLPSSLLATLRWGVVAGSHQLQGQGAGDSRFQVVQKEGHLYWMSLH